jgi:phytoene desaturase
MKSVLIIGAGIGGIATAARLALQDYRVTVIEKCEQAGGRCGQLVKDGYRFDTGATLFLMPQLYAETFADLGERIEDHLDLRRVDPSYHIHFPDGTNLDLTSDLNAMQTQLEAIEPGSFEAHLRYLNEGYHHYHLALSHLVKRDFRSLSEFITLKNLVLLFRLKALVNHYTNLGRYFNDPRLKIAYSFQNMYMGLSPFEAPAIYSLLQYTEFADGIWFPMGGMYRVVEALVGIAEKLGVQFIYNMCVEKILVDDSKANGVTLTDGRRIPADLVVANADLPYVYRHLLPDDGTAAKLERMKFGCSAIVFYWGLDKQVPKLGVHNLFMAGVDRQNFDPIFHYLFMPEPLSFYVHAPARVDPSLAPERGDSLMVAIPVGHIDEASPQDWNAFQVQARQAVLKKLSEFGISDFEEHIQFEQSYTPLDWHSRYNLVKGSTHGMSHNITQMGYLRPSNRHRRYRNLYFVGASTHPGTGMPTVLVSAQLVTDRILEEVGAPRTVSRIVTAVSN